MASLRRPCLRRRSSEESLATRALALRLRLSNKSHIRSAKACSTNCRVQSKIGQQGLWGKLPNLLLAQAVLHPWREKFVLTTTIIELQRLVHSMALRDIILPHRRIRSCRIPGLRLSPARTQVSRHRVIREATFQINRARPRSVPLQRSPFSPCRSLLRHRHSRRRRRVKRKITCITLTTLPLVAPLEACTNEP